MSGGRGWAVLVAAVVVGLFPAAAQAKTWQVTTQSDPASPVCPSASNCSIRGALAAAAAGDTIDVPAGDYDLSQGPLEMAQPVTLAGAGASKTKIDALGASRVVSITAFSSSPAAISGVTITGGKVTGSGFEAGGGGIFIMPGGLTGQLTLTGVVVTKNSATLSGGSISGGGGIWDDRTPLALVNSLVTDNMVSGSMQTDDSGGAGIYIIEAPTSLTTTTVDLNTLKLSGGGQNLGGGGIYESADALTLTSSHADRNSVTLTGGPTDSGGGGIYEGGSTISLSESTASNNELTTTGGGSVDGGGGIAQDGNATTLVSSSANGNTLHLSGDVTTSGGAGLLQSFNPLTVTASSIAGNTGTINGSSPSFDGGGGVYDEGSTNYLNTTLSNNKIQIPAATPTGENGGGAIFGYPGSSNTLKNATVADNSTDAPGGAIWSGGQLTFGNTIVGDNKGGTSANCAGSGETFDSLGHNLESANTCGLDQTSDHTDKEPLLAPLGSYGGPTLTQPPLFGSPAIGAGTCAFASTDQRGDPRPAPGHSPHVCDIGSVELQPVSNTSKPRISGVPAPGKILTCSSGTWKPPAPAFDYQWTRGGKVITGATAKRYRVERADDAQHLACRVTPVGALGNPVVSAGVVAEGAPINTAAPKISGKAVAGGVLHCSKGTWKSAPKHFSYEWKRDGHAIGGAHGPTYHVRSADQGRKIACVVIASNSFGKGAPASSHSVTVRK